MEEQSQPADAADLARFGYKQELRLAQAIEDQSLEWANGGIYSLEEYPQIKHVMASHD